MAGIPGGTYSTLAAGGSVTAISMEGGEINAFGSTYTGLELGEVKSYPKIKDDLTSLEVVDNTTEMLLTGLAVTAIFAGLAIATVVTGGAALAACALAGAAVGTGAASVGMYQSDKKTGYDRGWDEFALGLAVGAASGAMTGAVLYGTVIAAPAAGTIAGMQAEYYLGASAFTQTVVPAIMTTGTYGLAATTGVYAANDIYASNSGYNVILDKVFNNDVGKYEAAGMVLYALNGAVVEYVAANEFLLNAKKGIQFEGGSESGRETELFLPDEFYNKNLSSQVTPGTKYLPKYDEFGNVKQIKMYDDYGREIGWVDYTNHGYGDIGSPDYHTIPHWHERIYNAQNRDGMKINHRTDINTPLGDK